MIKFLKKYLIFILGWVGVFIIATLFKIPAFIAKKICGDLYMIEPDVALRAQGILSDRACGFDTDMITAAVLVAGFFVGAVVVGLKLFRKIF